MNEWSSSRFTSSLNKALCVAATLALPCLNAGAENDYVVAERGAHHAVWERVTWSTNQFGEITADTDSYAELATGLNFFDEASQQWLPSREEWRAYADGIVAQAGRHKAIIGHNLRLTGSVDVLAADGVRLTSTPIGLGLFDPIDGKHVMLGEINDCAAQWGTTTNEIVFRDCFDGIRGSMRYLYTRAGFHQHVVLEQKLRLPEGFSDKTQLEFYTAFANDTPQPQIETRVLRAETNPTLRALMVEPDLTDSWLEEVASAALASRAASVAAVERALEDSGPRVMVEHGAEPTGPTSTKDLLAESPKAITPRPASWQRHRVAVGVVALGALGALGATARWVAHEAPPPRASVVSEPRREAPPPIETSPTAGLSGFSTPPGPATDHDVEQAKAPPRAPANRRRGAAAPAARPPLSTAQTCDPPYTLDPSGIRIPKSGCK